MKINIQLISFILFFMFGITLFLTYELLCKKKPYRSYLILPIMTILFLYVLYFKNGGIVHPYFIISLILGIIISKVAVKKAKLKLKLLKQKK